MILNDKHKYLIALYQGLQNGYILPDDISEQEYKYVKEHQEDDPILSGFVGFGCSFGGKWFGGYGRSKNRSHATESKRALIRDMALLKNTEFICKDYRSVELPNHCVIYLIRHTTTQQDMVMKNSIVTHFGNIQEMLVRSI